MTLVNSFLLNTLVCNWTNISLIITTFYVLRSFGYQSLLLWGVSLHVVFVIGGNSPGLFNVLAAIHPVIVLGCYSVIAYGYYACTPMNQYFILVVGLYCTLFLGGWWAFQEFTWGGWWNWDGVEVPLLLLSLYVTLIKFHNIYSRSCRSVTEVNARQLVTILLLSLFIVRYAGFFSVHSFIISGQSYSVYKSAALAYHYKYYLMYCALTSLSLTTLIFLKVALFLFLALLWYSFKLSRLQQLSHLSGYILVIWLLCNNYNLYTHTALLTDSLSFKPAFSLCWLKPTTWVTAHNLQSLNSLTN